MRRGHPAIWIAVPLLVLGCDRAAPPPDPPSPPEATATAAKPAPLPRWPQPLITAMQLNSRGQYEQARRIATQYLGLNPGDGRAEFMIGMTYHEADNHEPAIEHFARALELSPDYYVTHHYYGRSLFLVGDLEEARRQHEAHAAADPTHPEAPYGLGLVDLEEGLLDDAVTRFGAAIELHLQRKHPSGEGLSRCHARLADVHFARDDYEAARDELIEATTLNPEATSAFYSLSLVHRRLGEDDLADEALDRYERLRQAFLDRSRARGAGGRG